MMANPQDNQYGYQDNQQQPLATTNRELPPSNQGLDPVEPVASSYEGLTPVASGYQGLDYQASQLAQQNTLQLVQNSLTAQKSENSAQNEENENSAEISPRVGATQQQEKFTPRFNNPNNENKKFDKMFEQSRQRTTSNSSNFSNKPPQPQPQPVQ